MCEHSAPYLQVYACSVPGLSGLLAKTPSSRGLGRKVFSYYYLSKNEKEQKLASKLIELIVSIESVSNPAEWNIA